MLEVILVLFSAVKTPKGIKQTFAVKTLLLKWGEEIKIKFCFKLGKSASETCKMLQQMYGDYPLLHSSF